MGDGEGEQTNEEIIYEINIVILKHGVSSA